MKPISSRSGPRPVRILLVDDHPVVRLGFEQLLSREAGLTVCGEASTASGVTERRITPS